MNIERRKLIEKALDDALGEHKKLRPAALQKRIAIEHQIGCFKYALNYPQEIISESFVTAAALVVDLLKHRSIEPSLALGAWGICGIAGRDDLLSLLAETDPERLGSQHGVPRYVKMLTSIFQANQAAWHGDKEKVLKEIQSYDYELTRRRTNRTFARWSQGLRNIHFTWAKNHEIEYVLDQRKLYLEKTYKDKNIDHEGLLDIHGLGILAATRLGGYDLQISGNPFPIFIRNGMTTS